MKRAHENSERYAVIETSDEEGTYVEFVPQLWLELARKSTLKQRDLVQFYFPRRTKQQSRDNFLRFLKQAKFMCTKPLDDGKWELKNGRILKLNLGSLEEALSAEKYYSDYFSTTEAEKNYEKAAASSTKKVMRKTKKAFLKSMNKVGDSSDSDDNENGGVNAISNYNIRFATDAQDLFTLDQSNNILSIDMDQLAEESLFGSGNQTSHSVQQPTSYSQTIQPTFSSPPNRQTFASLGNFAEPLNETFMAINEVLNEEDMNEERISEMDGQVSATETDLQNCAPNTDCCKGHQKILNKIDYVQKKLSKELGQLRQETNGNRKLLLQLLKRNEDDGNGQPEDVQDEPVHLDMAEIDEFNEKFKSVFPIKDSEYLIHFNKSLKMDQKFADNLLQKLEQMKGDDETKTARKILKALCHFECLKDFTWLGTRKMKSFQDLHLIVDMMTKLIEGKYPQCDAMSILTKVVQQRTKSAKEAWSKQNESLSVSQVVDSGADTVNKNDKPTNGTPTIENETVVIVVPSSVETDDNMTSG
ncbi:uncharacterized protein LOC119071484 [Bradysia coprophila]|uniref:uncharacterized protein LOC119071484 n=1 Tax=Bradysia coprophila TaxID=38358 RepID=UPI00187DC0DF|nr:uncharacterized protein LOC119071484 [Bradysia coprophila]